MLSPPRTSRGAFFVDPNDPRGWPGSRRLQDVLQTTRTAMDNLVSHVEGEREMLERDRQLYEDQQARLRFETESLLDIIEGLSRSQQYLDCRMRDMQDEGEAEDNALESKIVELLRANRECNRARRDEFYQAVKVLAQDVQNVTCAAEIISNEIKLNKVESMNPVEGVMPQTTKQDAAVCIPLEQVPSSKQSKPLELLSVHPMKMAATSHRAPDFIDVGTPSMREFPVPMASHTRKHISSPASPSSSPFEPARSVAPLRCRAPSAVIQEKIQEPSPVRPSWQLTEPVVPTEHRFGGHMDRAEAFHCGSPSSHQSNPCFVFPHTPRILPPAPLSPLLQAPRPRQCASIASSPHGSLCSTMLEGDRTQRGFGRQLSAVESPSPPPVPVPPLQAFMTSQTGWGECRRLWWQIKTVPTRHSPMLEDRNDYSVPIDRHHEAVLLDSESTTEECASFRSTLSEASLPSCASSSPVVPRDMRLVHPEVQTPPHSPDSRVSTGSRAASVDTEMTSNLGSSATEVDVHHGVGQESMNLSPETRLALKTIGFLESRFDGMKRDFRFPTRVELDFGSSNTNVDMTRLNALTVARAAKLEGDGRRVKCSTPLGEAGSASSVHLHIHRLDELLGLLDSIDCGEILEAKEQRKHLVSKVLKEAGEIKRWMEMVCVSAERLVE